MGSEVEQNPGFFVRVGLAFKVLGDAALAGRVSKLLVTPEVPRVTEPPKPAGGPKAVPAEKTHASGLFVLATLQQEGRLIDFLQQDVTGFSDEEIGAAARVVHGGCRKGLQRLVTVQGVLNQEEGAPVTVPAGFDANRIRLTGNVTGQPPYNGTLKHHGWAATNLQFPALADSVDYRVLAPAEVEL
jgi:hypothetical protein